VAEPNRLWHEAAVAEQCAKLGGVVIDPRRDEVGFRAPKPEPKPEPEGHDDG
jgi:hypothetical protein